VRKKKLGSSDTRSQKDIPITEFFNTTPVLDSWPFSNRQTAGRVGGNRRSVGPPPRPALQKWL